MNVAFVVPASGSVTVTSLIESAGSESSSRIVPSPVPSAIAALTAFERSTVNVSSSSSTGVARDRDGHRLGGLAGANVSVPLVAA